MRETEMLQAKKPALTFTGLREMEISLTSGYQKMTNAVILSEAKDLRPGNRDAAGIKTTF